MIELAYKIVTRTYHRYLASKLAEYPWFDLNQHKQEINNQAKAIFTNNQDMVVDFASHFHLRVACLIQASYLTLLKNLDNRELIIDILKFALVEAFRKFLALPFGLALNVTRTGFIKLLNVMPGQLVNNLVFGRGFKMVTTVRDPNQHEFIYQACLYNSFFRKNSTPELTQIICYADNAWIDEISPNKHSLQFERPITLANGQDKCVFKLIKLNRKQ